MSRNNWTDDKLLDRLLKNKSNKTRWDNISILRNRPTKVLFQNCVVLSKSTDPRARCIGIDILAQMGLPPRPFLKQTIKLFFGLLKSENDPEVLMSLLYAIGHNNEDFSANQIEKLCSLSSTTNNWIKEGLVFALIGINNEYAIETLIKLSDDKSSHIRNWATFGIGSQIETNNQDITTALWKRVNDKHNETRHEAIVGLARRKDNLINAIILEELKKGEYGTLLLEAIIETGDVAFLPILNQHLKKDKNDKSISPEWLETLNICIINLKAIKEKTERPHNTG